MLNFVAILPHAPVLVPGVDEKNFSKALLTFNGAREIAEIYNKKVIDTLVFVLPPSSTGENSNTDFTIILDKKARGNLSQFGAWKISSEISTDQFISKEITRIADVRKAKYKKIMSVSGVSKLDYEFIVPFNLLLELKENIEEEFVVIRASSDKDKNEELGRVIKDVLDTNEKSFGLVISGDLAHNHEPNKLPQKSKKYDDLVIESLEESKINKLAKQEKEREFVGEDIYNQLIVLDKVLQDEKWQVEIHSYEKPFNIGYLCADIELK